MMQNHSPFTIYNASAGSGKTFTLVKDYLKILIQSNTLLSFRNVLALTFTNKAVAEMKERIIETLQQFSHESILDQPHNMFIEIVEELDIEPRFLHNKAKSILHTVVHNYAAFDISTIDKFNHKLIRTFAHDLKLPLNFEVELDTSYILGKAVDKLIDKAGTDKELTKVLVDFAIEKADDDKSWDIAYDFNAVAKLLVNENEIPFIETIKNKSLGDFKLLKADLIKNLKSTENKIINLADSALELIKTNSLEFEDFSRGTLPNHFKKAAKLDFNRLYDNLLQSNIEERKSIYTKTLDAEKATSIDRILPQIETIYLELKQTVYNYKFISNVIKNMTPLSVLNIISKTLQELKDEDEILLISEFNSIISTEIKNQPTPFIYERIGEKFKHYFIDEFQDTSVLQWENLTPLISHALASGNLNEDTGTAMLVGDAKQAIYRWRGGKAEQFIDLYTKNYKPFVVEQDVKNLPVNYRSSKAVVAFNNAFFKHLSGFAFSNPEHQAIYQQSHQNQFLKHEGYVELSFLEIKDEDKDQLHCDKVLETINKAITNGFDLEDICIITRKTKEGIAIAKYLSSQNISIVSSESLLLQNSPEVNFMACVINLVTQPKNNELKIEILSYLAEHQLHLEDKHEFYHKLVHLDPNAFFNGLKEYGFDFNFDTFLQLPLYEATETILRQFKLNKTSNAYLQFYLDEVLDYSQKHNVSYSGFIDFWERKKEKLSIVSPQGINAVQIMTIHKSKGLEFPIVIFPYANQDIYFDMTPKTWFKVDKDHYNGFSHLYINLNKELENYNELGASIYNNHQSELELDAINLLYVVLTRAAEQLYIISEYDVGKNENEKLKLYSGVFINYLKSINKWNDERSYSFGNPERSSCKKKPLKELIEQTQFISTKKEDHNLNIVTSSGYLWDTAQEQAIEKGNLVHNIMAHIKTEKDIEFIFDQFIISGKISTSQEKELRSIILDIVNHSLLKAYFHSELTIYNEKDIITKHGQILRPDRVVTNSKNEAVIIDYKTGLENTKHKQQIQDYQYTLEAMNFKVIKKILVYINDAIEVKEF
jgi:ATP-dependent exoDNAse (exonuclease V) beta subunit